MRGRGYLGEIIKQQLVKFRAAEASCSLGNGLSKTHTHPPEKGRGLQQGLHPSPRPPSPAPCHRVQYPQTPPSAVHVSRGTPLTAPSEWLWWALVLGVPSSAPLPVVCGGDLRTPERQAGSGPLSAPSPRAAEPHSNLRLPPSLTGATRYCPLHRRAAGGDVSPVHASCLQASS